MAVDSDQLVRIVLVAAAPFAFALLPLVWEAIKESALFAWRRYRTRAESKRAGEALAQAIHSRRAHGQWLDRDGP